MYTFDWKPKAKKDVKLDEQGLPVRDENGKLVLVEKEPVMTGVVKIKIPKHAERIKYVKSLNTKIVDGELHNEDGLGGAEKMLDFAKQQIESVDLVRKEDGYIFNSIDLLDHDADGAEILTDIAKLLIEGVRLGKN